MVQFDAAPVVTSIPNCVNGKEFISRNRELLDDMRNRGREASPVLRFIVARCCARRIAGALSGPRCLTGGSPEPLCIDADYVKYILQFVGDFEPRLSPRRHFAVAKYLAHRGNGCLPSGIAVRQFVAIGIDVLTHVEEIPWHLQIMLRGNFHKTEAVWRAR
jgi:hypothetical protein